ncbi:MAG: hypothetical protein V4501_01680 [Pseudomonadota bacterium]
MKKWLIVANGGDEDLSCWQFGFDNQISLPDYLATQASQLMQTYRQPKWYQRIFTSFSYRRQNTLFVAQDYMKNIHSLWKTIQTEKNPQIPAQQQVQLSWWKRILSSFIKRNQYDFIPAVRKADASIWENTRIVNIMRADNSLPAKDALPDHSIYTLNNLFDHTAIMQVENKIDKSGSEKLPIPKELKHWTKAAGLTYQVDQNHAVSQSVAQQVQNSHEAELMLHVNNDTALNYTAEDASIGQDYAPFASHPQFKVQGKIHALTRAFTGLVHGRQNSHTYISDLASQLEEKYKKELRITKNAMEIIMNGVTVDTQPDVNHLPLGFFLKEGSLKQGRDSASFIWLCYDEKLRLAQLKDPKNIFRPDPAQNKQYVTTYSDEQIFHGDGEEKYNNHVNREKMIKELTTESLIAKLSYIKDPLLKDELGVLLNKSRSFIIKGKITDKFIFCYMEGSHRDNLIAANVAEESLFNSLADVLLYKTTENEVGKLIKVIKTFITLVEQQDFELSWFFDFYQSQLENRGQDQRDAGLRIDFEKSVKSFLYFIEFMKDRNVKIPKVTPFFVKYDVSLIANDILSNMKYMMDIISLVPDSSLQMDFFNHAGVHHLAEGLKLIKSGYCFFHNDMAGCDSYEINHDMMLKISFDQQKSAAHYRRIFLCYISYNCNPENVRKALEFWKSRTGENLYESNPDTDAYNAEMQTQIGMHWNQLREFAVSLPTKLAPVQYSQKEVDITKVSQLCELTQNQTGNATQFLYAQEDVLALFEKLNIDKQSALGIFLQKNINTLNDYAPSLNEVDATTLKDNLQSLRDKLKNNPEALGESLAWLREAYFRLSGCKKWLRLEQAIAVLAPMNGDVISQLKTSEGKTFIVQLQSFLKALSGQKQDVITHTEMRAEEDAQAAQPLAKLVGLKVCSAALQQSAEINSADVLYVDIFNGVMRSKLELLNKYQGEQASEIKEESPLMPRQPEGVIVDELDHIAIDVHAKMSMKIVDQARVASPEFEEFLFKLNEIVRGQAILTYKEKAEQREYLKTQLLGNTWWHTNGSDTALDFWMNAAITAMSFSLHEDYVIVAENSNHVVRIVHKETTGRVDQVSQWDSGVHQCVSAFEKAQGRMVKITELSNLLFVGNVRNFLNRYKSRTGCTGTLGEPEVCQMICEIMNVDNVIVFPRAKRELSAREKEANVAWPKINAQTVYNRSYHFNPIYIEEDQHWAQLLIAVRRAKAQDRSMILFFKTIAECQRFHDFLERNGVDKIQILDDTHPGDQKGQSLRPSEELLKRRAGDKGMTTISTAAGGRATDFSGIDYAVVTEKSLHRVVEQALGRIGRDRQFGITYQMYALNQNELLAKAANPLANYSMFAQYSTAEQSRDLDIIRNRKQHDDDMDALQNDIESILDDAADECKDAVKQVWPRLFARANQGEKPGTVIEELIQEQVSSNPNEHVYKAVVLRC